MIRRTRRQGALLLICLGLFSEGFPKVMVLKSDGFLCRLSGATLRLHSRNRRRLACRLVGGCCCRVMSLQSTVVALG